ncbi:MAG: aminopeptidase [Pseudomonadota bacterium]|nr:aminopeptidase [Pseudomonadota bacterium]
MNDPRIVKLAELLVNYSVKIGPDDKVLVNGAVETAPLLKEVCAQVLRAGGHPLPQVSIPETEEIMYRLGSDRQLTFIHPPTKMGIETYDATISISGADNTKNLNSVDPARVALRNQARREIMDIFMQRSAIGELRWVGTLFPTNAYAQDAELSLREYEDFFFTACLPDLDDPIGYWERKSADQQRLVDWLRGRRRIRVTAPDTDLTLEIAERLFINCDGRHNMPDGEVFTGPMETSVEGTVRFSYPAIYQGRELTGVRLTFKEGKVIAARADKNEDFLNKILDTDAGSRYVGEFAIGTNDGIQRFTKQILFDEKISGSFHLALGAGYPETGSRNRSAIHWDLICDLRQGGEIRVDDVLLYKDGRFTLD